MEECHAGVSAADGLSRPAFSPAEYGRRLQETRRRMAGRGIDCLLIHSFPNIYYLTGLETVAPHKYFMLAVPLEGEAVLVSQDFETHNALLGACISEIVAYELMADPIPVTADLVVHRGWHRGRLGLEYDSRGLRVSDHASLVARLPGVAWVDASGLVDDVKIRKSESELEYVRLAGRWSSLGMKAAAEAVCDGATDNDVAAAAYHTLMRAGCEYMCYAPIVTAGRRAGIPHSTHQRIPLERGAAVLIEIGACCRRYSAPIMRTASIGEAHDEVRRLLETAAESVATIIENMRPGAVGGEIARKAKEKLRRLPEDILWHGYYGYSVGVGFPPEWNDGLALIREESELILEPGMVFHCNTSFRRIGQFGVAVSETVAVTATGSEVLTDYPRTMVVR